jgi:hypothetical protein
MGSSCIRTAPPLAWVSDAAKPHHSKSFPHKDGASNDAVCVADSRARSTCWRSYTRCQPAPASHVVSPSDAACRSSRAPAAPGRDSGRQVRVLRGVGSLARSARDRAGGAKRITARRGGRLPVPRAPGCYLTAQLDLGLLSLLSRCATCAMSCVHVPLAHASYQNRHLP